MDGGTDVNVQEWASSGAGFEAALRLARETSCALFGNCMDVGGALSDGLEALRNRLVAVDLHDLQNWYSAVHARAAEDLAVLQEAAFMAALMDVKTADGTWLPILRDVLLMRENLDLRWIPPSEYLILGDRYYQGSVHLVSFLNDVDVERWSLVETAVDGETRETTDLGPVYINPEANATTEVAGGAEAGTLPQPSSTATSGSAGTAPAEIGCDEGTISWTHAITEGFAEVPDGEVLTSVL
jgi:hypothetical protein